MRGLLPMTGGDRVCGAGRPPRSGRPDLRVRPDRDRHVRHDQRRDRGRRRPRRSPRGQGRGRLTRRTSAAPALLSLTLGPVPAIPRFRPLSGGPS
jgi:hypothetical protein